MKYYFVIVYLLGLIKCENVLLMVGGEVADIRNFAHSAFLKVKCGKKAQSFICGTSIINQRMMLTAAHCVVVCTYQEKQEGKTMTVSVGHSHSAKGFVHRVNSCYIHEEFRSAYFYADIALLKLNNDLEFSRDVQRVALMRHPPNDKKAQVAGWGLIKVAPQENTKTLHYINQYVLTKSKCRKSCPQLPDGTFCAKSKDSSSYAAGGDSGGALIVKGYIQIGIVSFKMVNASKSLTFYTDTGYHYSWITRNTKEFYC